MNSFVLFFNGGYDKDSKYAVHVNPTDPQLPADTSQTPVLDPRPENGSPVAFRGWFINKLDPFGVPFIPAQSGPYPVYDPNSVFRQLTIGFYQEMFQSGKVYALIRAEDGDGALDNSVRDPRTVVDDVDNGVATPAELALRRKVLVFYVNKAPFLLTRSALFSPQPGSTISVRRPTFNLQADDIDPLDPAVDPRRPGVPTPTKVFRFKVTVIGKNSDGNDTTYTYLPSFPNTSPYFFNQFSFTFNQDIPNYIVPGPMTINVELCDCADCEERSGQGRCVQYNIPVTFTAPPSVTSYSSSADRGNAR